MENYFNEEYHTMTFIPSVIIVCGDELIELAIAEDLKKDENSEESESDGE